MDEADKAPSHVTAYLKTLAEDGEMLLADGRRIQRTGTSTGTTGTGTAPSTTTIPLHPSFRMIVLANRPGFPFLGNDFFGTLHRGTCLNIDTCLR